MSKKILTTEKMWKLIEESIWTLDHDYKRIERLFDKSLSKDHFKQLCHFVYNKKDELKKRFEQAWLGDQGIEVSDDGWDDLCAEVVGRGSEFYGKINVPKLRNMANTEDYHENFAYAFQKYMPEYKPEKSTKKNYKIEHIEMASINEDQIPTDVLERIDGYEVLSDLTLDTNDVSKRNVYAVSQLNKIASEGNDNDTNETTRIRMAELWYAVKKYKYLMIVSK
ncbi:MAG: hypothetical protein Q8O88_03710 [bacterium]|nr:hypothetical protein [bacterium]